MAENSHISWTDHTFNPWIGCAQISDGCRNCYAENDRFLGRSSGAWGARGTRRITADANWRKPAQWNRQAQATGISPRVFCLSMGDLLEDRPELAEPRTRLWTLIDDTPALTWMLLSKRIGDAVSMVPPAWSKTWPAHVWAGTSVENQRWADERLPHLAKVPAALRFLSVEPLLGPVTLDLAGIGWVLVGGESGKDRRPMDPDWLAGVVEQCQTAGVPIWVKQDSAFRSEQRGRIPDHLWIRELPRAAALTTGGLW